MLSDVIRADLYRQGGLVGFKGFLKGLTYPGFRYLFVYRNAKRYRKTPLIIFIKILRRRYKIKTGYEISSDAQIGKGLYLSSHFGHVVVGPIKMGDYCCLNHSVTIGRAYKNGKIGRPTIGNFVWIGTGAVIVGEINIGNDVLIAPNAFVNFDVPDHSLVIGNPGKIIEKENPTKNYINFVFDDANKHLHKTFK